MTFRRHLLALRRFLANPVLYLDRQDQARELRGYRRVAERYPADGDRCDQHFRRFNFACAQTYRRNFPLARIRL